MYDSSRDIDNPVAEYIIPNSAEASGTTNSMDFNSNGFKVLNKDTFLTIPITNKYGKFILNRIIDGVSDVELLDQMRGIAFVPGENNKQIVSFDLENDNSKF